MATHLKTWGTYWLYSGGTTPAEYDIWGEIEVYLDSQSKENNTSSIFIDHYIYANYTSSGNLGVYNTVSSTYRVNNGSYGGIYNSVSAGVSVEPNSQSKTYLGRTWHNVYHDDNGAATLYVSGYISMNGSTTSSSFSGVTLPTIARSSTIAATRAYVGEVSQITVSQRNTSYTHSIKYSFGSLSGYIAADGTISTNETKYNTTSIPFTVPTSFYTEIPDTPRGDCTLSVTTYDGDTVIGNIETTSFVVEVEKNSSNIPSLTATVVDVNSLTTNLTDTDTKLIRGYSTASINYTASGKNSASIKTIQINGSTITDNPHLIYNFDASEIVVKAIDTREFDNTVIPTHTIIDYFEPSISVTGKRTSPTSNEIKVTFNGNIFNQTFGDVYNTLKLSWKYRVKGSTEWIDGSDFVAGVDYILTGNTFHSGTGSYTSEISLGELFTYEKSFEIGIFCGDEIVTPIPTSVIIPRGKPIVNWNSKGFYINGELFIKDKNPFLMSNEETIIGLYDDGRPVYQKIITFTTSINGDTLFTRAHNISDVDIIWLNAAHSRIYATDSDCLSYPMPTVGYGEDLTSILNCYVDKNNIYIYSNGGWNTIWTKVVVLNYTKTTDIEEE